MMHNMSLRLPNILQPKSLRQRTTFYVLLPTLLILLTMGTVSLLLVRQVLLDQWRQAAIAMLQTTAHQVDMRLMRPKKLLMLLRGEGDTVVNQHVSCFLLDRLRRLEGVTQVDLEWSGPLRSNQGRQYRRVDKLEISTPVYDSEFKDKTISLVSEFIDGDNRILSHVEIKIAFYDLINEVLQSFWWKNNKAFLVDRNGNVLSRTTLMGNTDGETASPTFGKASELEKKTLELLQQQEYGTVFGSGMPPGEISGFYSLKEAPWTLVLIVPGEQALLPVSKFRNFYLLTGVIGILSTLFLIRLATVGTTNAVDRLSRAANNLASGDFSPPLTITSKDEVGELIRNFNLMTSQLKERMELRQAISFASEVQRNMLPQSSYSAKGLTISGTSIYCRETGGDYFDILPDRLEPQRVSVVVGDVVGHGIGAALQMATIRALVRCRTSLPGSGAERMADINEMLCRDTTESGDFVTLFYLDIDRSAKLLR